MDVSFIHSNIEKVPEKTKLRRVVAMQGGEGYIQIHQASNIDGVGGEIITNSGIVKNIKLLQLIKLQDLRGKLPVKSIGSELQLCQQFLSG